MNPAECFPAGDGASASLAEQADDNPLADLMIRPINSGHCDIHLTFSTDVEPQVRGFVVTDRNNADRAIAFCGVNARGSTLNKELAGELTRQLRIAARIASRPEIEEAEEAPVPSWIYTLRWIPLTRRGSRPARLPRC